MAHFLLPFAGSDGTYAPRISHKNLVNITVRVNSTAKFKCRQEKLNAIIDPPQFDWIKWINSDYSTLDIDYGNFTIIDTNTKYRTEPATEEYLHVSYLTIHNVTMDDTGLYSCVVCNQYGRDYSSAFLSLNTTPAPG